MTPPDAPADRCPAAPSARPSLVGLTDREYERIRDLVYARFGINLTEQKRSLIIGRLQKVLRQRGLSSFSDYLASVEADASGRLLAELVNRISTNHTFFYREKDHFDFLTQTVLPTIIEQLRAAGTRDLRLWCAGCATGEEAYMLLMLLHEILGHEYRQWEAGILATDISEQALATARAGIYNEDRVAQLPAALRNTYLRPAGAGRWEVRPDLRQEATFRRLNLMNAHFPFRHPFHIIFCRNVMIYFDQPTRHGLVVRLHRHTAPGGYLFIGHSESLGRTDTPYRYIRPAVYQKEPDA